MRFWLAALVLTASTAARSQCFYADLLDNPRPIPCPEQANYPDPIPPPPPGTVWIPATGRPHVYKAELLLRQGPNGITQESGSLEGASLPAILAHPDGRLTPTRYPDGERSDGGHEVKAARAPGGRFCAFVILTERDANGNYYGENVGPCPEDHAVRGLSQPPPGHMWIRMGPKRGEMHLARFVVPTSSLGPFSRPGGGPPGGPGNGPPDHPPGPVPLLRSAAEAAPVSAAVAVEPARPRVVAEPAPVVPAETKPAQPKPVDHGPMILLLIVVVVGAAGYGFGRLKSASPARPSFSASWTRADAKTAAATNFGPPAHPPTPPTVPTEALTTPPPPAALLVGRYEFKGRIGEGGMGVVLEGFDHSLGRKVAIKVMRPEIAHGEGAREAFLREAKIISHLSHPYIVAIHEVVENADGVYLIFDFVDGEPLSSVLKRRGRLPLGECVKVFTYVCEAISCAHRARVLHRDLKPSNIMIDSAGYAKVMDFGIAREAKETITRLTAIEASGTPAFMAPEQHLGRCAKTSDIYALGVCLYQAMTGSLPFQGPDFLAQKERMKYAPPQFLAPELPKEVELLFAATLAADPKHRVADAAELIDSLKSLRA